MLLLFISTCIQINLSERLKHQNKEIIGSDRTDVK